MTHPPLGSGVRRFLATFDGEDQQEFFLMHVSAFCNLIEARRRQDRKVTAFFTVFGEHLAELIRIATRLDCTIQVRDEQASAEPYWPVTFQGSAAAWTKEAA